MKILTVNDQLWVMIALTINYTMPQTQGLSLLLLLIPVINMTIPGLHKIFYLYLVGPKNETKKQEAQK